MTVDQIVEAARNNLNAVSDTLWSDAELYMSLYQCEIELARESLCIQNTDSSTTTVSGTSDYAAPTRAMDVWRVLYDNKKLQRIDYRELDAVDRDATSADTGTPIYYAFWDDTIRLYPVPTEAKTLKVYSYDSPATVSASSTLEVPAFYHDVLVNGLTYKMCPKDLGNPLTTYWENLWLKGIGQVTRKEKMRRQGDRMSVVKREEDMLTTTEFGVI